MTEAAKRFLRRAASCGAQLLEQHGSARDRRSEQVLRQHVHSIAHAEDAVGAGLVGAEEQLVPGDFLRAFHFAGQKQRALVGEVGDDGVHFGGNAAAHHGVGGQRAAIVGDAPALEVAAGRGQRERGIGLKGGEERLLGLLALLVGLGVLLAASGEVSVMLDPKSSSSSSRRSSAFSMFIVGSFWGDDGAHAHSGTAPPHGLAELPSVFDW